MNKNISLRTKRFASLSLVTTLTAFVVLSLISRPMNAAPQVVYSNTAPITLTTAPVPPTIATPYPSTINVSGMTGTTTKVTVTLSGITHGLAGDLDILLVSPTGGKSVLMSDAGNNQGANNVTVTFDQAATSTMDFNSFSSGTYRPTNWSFGSADSYPAPAPAPPYLLDLNAAFNTTDPNGAWSLYVVDDGTGNNGPANIGNIAQGWSLNITTTGSPATSFSNTGNITINDDQTIAATYPSTINITGATGVVTGLTVTLHNVTHTRLADVDILLVNPNGIFITLLSDAASFASGGSAVNNVTLTFDDNAATTIPDTGTITSGTYQPTNIFNGFETFPPPAPPGPFASGQQSLLSLGIFSPNGTWSLYIVDDRGGESGTIAGGWSLDITTQPFVAPVLGCGAPSFSGPENFSTGTAPTHVATGDFNGDTKLDLVTTNQNSNNVSVMLGDGAGGFSAATNFGVGTYPYAVAVGDFNSDNKQDLAVANSGSNNVSVLSGDGMGSFGAPVNYNTGPSPISVAVGDFNGDTKPDLAVAEFGGFFAGSVSVLMNTGTGTFNPAVSFPARTQPSFVVVGEFNGDSNQDLAVANYGSNNVSILLGNGAGSFSTTPPVVSVSLGPVSIALADFNSDGKQDLAVANYNSDTISLRFGAGNGTFANPGFNVGVGGNPISVKATDLSGDGKPDIIAANRSSNNIAVLLNNGTGSFLSPIYFDIGVAPSSVVVGTFNDNLQPDLATSNSSSNNVAVLLNACGVAKGNRLDFDADRKTDFTVFRPSNNTWYIQRSSNNGPAFTQVQFATVTDKFVPEDYNGDGTTDLAYFRPSTARWVVPGIYDIEFGISTDIPVPTDYDGDGRADIAVYRPSEGAWYIRRSIDNNWMSFLFGTAEDKPVPRDYDGDGKADIAIFRPSAAGWYILRSSDNQVRGVQFGISTDRPVPADYDGDGKADVAVFRPADSAWYIEKSSDSMVLSYAWGINGDVPVQGDYDGDGKFDIAIYRPSTNYFYVRRSTNGALQAQLWGTSGDIPIAGVFVP